MNSKHEINKSLVFLLSCRSGLLLNNFVCLPVKPISRKIIIRKFRLTGYCSRIGHTPTDEIRNYVVESIDKTNANREPNNICIWLNH